MLANTSLPASSLAHSTVVWTAQCQRYAALAAQLMYPKTRGHGPRRAVRLRPSPLGRFPALTPETLAASSVPAVAATASQPSCSRVMLGLGRPSPAAKRPSVASMYSEPSSPRSRATVGLGHPSSFARSRVAPVAPIIAQPLSRAGLGLGHPSTHSKRLTVPQSITIVSPQATQQLRGCASIGLGHPSTSPKRPIAPVRPRPSPNTSRSYVHAAASQTAKTSTSRRVIPTSDSSRCAEKQSGGVLPSISAPALRSMSSGSISPQAGTTQVHAQSLEGAVQNATTPECKGMEVECEQGYLAAIGFKTLF